MMNVWKKDPYIISLLNYLIQSAKHNNEKVDQNVVFSFFLLVSKMENDKWVILFSSWNW